MDAQVHGTGSLRKGDHISLFPIIEGLQRQPITMDRVTQPVSGRVGINSHWSPDAQVQICHAAFCVCTMWSLCCLSMSCIMRGNKSYVKWGHVMDASSLAFFLYLDSFATLISHFGFLILCLHRTVWILYSSLEKPHEGRHLVRLIHLYVPRAWNSPRLSVLSCHIESVLLQLLVHHGSARDCIYPCSHR